MCRVIPSGLRRWRQGLVYVSRGVGGVELPVRTCASPEIVLVELVRRGQRAEAGAAGSTSLDAIADA